MLFRGGGRLFLVLRNLHGFAIFLRFSGAGKFARLRKLRGLPDLGNVCAFFPAREICLDLLVCGVFLERANLRRPAAPSAPRGSKRSPRPLRLLRPSGAKPRQRRPRPQLPTLGGGEDEPSRGRRLSGTAFGRGVVGGPKVLAAKPKSARCQ